MTSWPKHFTLKALRGFLGLTGHYCKFIQNYNKFVGPLTHMLKKGEFSWSPIVEEVFSHLNKAMAITTVLALPHFIQTITVECVASGYGIRVM